MGDSRHSLFGVYLLTGVVGLLATYGSAAAADDMVPFVIPAKVDSRSLVAMRGEPPLESGQFHGNLDTGFRPPFVVFLLVPLDGLPYEKSHKLLVTACGRCENTGMMFSDDRRTVGREWGKPPVLIEAVTSVPGGPLLPPGHWKCQALAPDGTEAMEVPVNVSQEKHREYVKFDQKYKIMWYALTRSE